MRSAAADLQLDHLYVIYPGADRFTLADAITALPATALAGTLAELE